MNNPIRAWIQRRFIARWMLATGASRGGRALELGCGRGVGIEIALASFGCSRVHACDLDPRMLRTARRRVGRRPDVFLLAADAKHLPVSDAAYDAIFDFGAVHVIADWELAIAEVARVLAPGGRYYFELVTNPVLRLAYPLTLEGFRRARYPEAGAFLSSLNRCGLEVVVPPRRPRWLPWTQLAGDLVGSAVRRM